MVRTMGFSSQFRPQPWTEIEEFLAEMAGKNPEFQYLVDIVKSVIASPASALIAGATSMRSIMVALEPIREPPIDIIFVHEPYSLHPAKTGEVRIEHRSVTGHNDSIDRPVAEAVPLFWRFVAEKFGVQGR